LAVVPVKTKRTAVSGRTPNTTNSGNSSYIAAGELALNMTDGILYSSNGSAPIIVGSNTINQNITGNLTVKSIVANGSLGTNGQVLSSNGTSAFWANASSVGLNLAPIRRDLFKKADPLAVAFVRTGENNVSIKAGTLVAVGDVIINFTSETAVQMPALVAGTDYAIWVQPDGIAVATDNFTSPPVEGARRIGGYYYAHGGNATGSTSGGNATPQINPYSLWDLKFRPTCPDPRGMAFVAGKFWCDIHLLGTQHIVNGTSKSGVTIADGDSNPRMPIMFGGSGSNNISLDWYGATDIMTSHGKTLLSQEDYLAAAYGASNGSVSSDPVSTIFRSSYTSAWGVMLATNNMQIWGAEVTGEGGRCVLGERWPRSGSRSAWSGSNPSYTSGYVGARGRSDHLCHA
jgi:hypothetical protein